MTITNRNGVIIVDLPDFQLHQEGNPQTGLPFTSEADAQAWLDGVLPKLQADLAKQLTTAPVIDLAAVQQLRFDRLMAINAQCEAAIEQVKMTYPITERETWDIQIAESHAYQADPANAITPFLTALGDTRSETVASLAVKVLANESALKQFSARNIGKRHLCERALKTIADTDPDAPEKIAAVAWSE
ncbi:hypothetical protein QN372_00865 [Undibacterium sp. RTI2.1]|uniref:hypothetical protein n=1 Tax=unclassified Undibacterium TaxID=2630295 RepID=UPI002AB45B2A|nr:MULTISPECIES: hypothetical protein [unclassified Undibacterium]MDY7537688.1 hypothetical protein [Undibacterium sp. 5I1]MEB0029290.1 hypothetical protein [Undibacterium sp. RTI2.1]MEB0115598.1 hypothetical protein [Undibacterium sp. RTI2.2]MEB0256425.1 hypothetical protein [Undibacterium sp. 5I1]